MNFKKSLEWLLLSFLIGVIFGIILHFILKWILIDPLGAFRISVASGLFCAIVLFLCLNAYQIRMNEKYSAIEKNFHSPVCHQTNGNFHLGHTVRNGNLYCCVDGIILVSLDEKPYFVEKIPADKLENSNYHLVDLYIVTTDQYLYWITTPDAEKTAAYIQKHYLKKNNF